MINSDSDLIKAIERRASIYSPSNDTVKQLGKVSLIAVVAPSVVGKSTVTGRILELDADFSRVCSFTTRLPRPQESEEAYDFRGNSSDALNAITRDIEEGKLVQFAVHRTTGIVYGSHSDQYQKRYCLLEALPTSIEQLDRLPF